MVFFFLFVANFYSYVLSMMKKWQQDKQMGGYGVQKGGSSLGYMFYIILLYYDV